MADSTRDVDDMTGPECLRWLYQRTGELNYLNRAFDWSNEVRRFAAYEGVTVYEYEQSALDEMRAHIADTLDADAAVECERRLSL